jgi:VanZ family protein
MGSSSARGATLLRWAPAAAWMALIFVLSAQPGLRISQDASVDGPIRHLVHVGMYAVLGVLLVHALHGSSWPVIGLAAWAIATLYGVSDEIHQSLVPDRSGNLLDVSLDAIGAGLGIVAVAAWPVVRDRLRPSRG